MTGEVNDRAMLRPPINRAMRKLDRAFFKRAFPIAAARISSNKDISPCRTLLLKSKDMLSLERFSTVQPDPDERLSQQGQKCLLLSQKVKHDGTIR